MRRATAPKGPRGDCPPRAFLRFRGPRWAGWPAGRVSLRVLPARFRGRDQRGGRLESLLSVPSASIRAAVPLVGEGFVI